MNLTQKVKVLGEAANYDTVCGSPRSTGMANKSLIDTVKGFVYRSRSENYDCRMLKVLQTNTCQHDCSYCLNSNSVSSGCAFGSSAYGQKKTGFEPLELAKIFDHCHKAGLVNSLFLSSGVAGDADSATETMLETVNLIRNQYKFDGYIHFKILPGVSKEFVKQAAEMCQRLSINIEAAGKQRLSELSSTKDFKNDILRRQAWIRHLDVKAGQTTQMIIGAQDESDREILSTVDFELNAFRLKRFYFSAFSPVKGTRLESHKPGGMLREHRLYNVEFMLRQYKFDAKEFEQVLDTDGMLPRTDPKVALANATLDRAVDVNSASADELIRVPGIGPKTAARIVAMRKAKGFERFEQLAGAGVSVARAKPYLKVGGWVQKRLNQW